MLFRFQQGTYGIDAGREATERSYALGTSQLHSQGQALEYHARQCDSDRIHAEWMLDRRHEHDKDMALFLHNLSRDGDPGNGQMPGLPTPEEAPVYYQPYGRHEFTPDQIPWANPKSQ